MARGYVRPAVHASGGHVLYIRVPELLASEASRVLAEELIGRMDEDLTEVASWLSATTSYLPLGDIIAAQAFVDAIQDNRPLLHDLIEALVQMPPKPAPIRPGMRAAALIGGRMVDLTFDKDGAVVVQIDGETHKIDGDADDPGMLLGNHQPWMILSHLAGLRIGTADGSLRIDLELLGEIGSCPHFLRHPESKLPGKGQWTHHIPGYGEVLCHGSGIIEPITFSLFKMLSREGSEEDEWIGRALESGSLGLLARVDIALRAIEVLIAPVADWAKVTRRDRIGPALRKAVACAVE